MLLWVTHPFLLKLPFDFSTWIDQFPYFRILGNKQSHDFSRAIFIELISTFFKDHKVHSPKVLVPFCWSLKNLLVPIHSKLHLKSCDYLYKYGRYRDVMRKRFIRWIKSHVYAKRQSWICTTWPSFVLNCRLLFITSTHASFIQKNCWTVFLCLFSILIWLLHAVCRKRDF